MLGAIMMATQLNLRINLWSDLIALLVFSLESVARLKGEGIFMSDLGDDGAR